MSEQLTPIEEAAIRLVHVLVKYGAAGAGADRNAVVVRIRSDRPDVAAMLQAQVKALFAEIEAAGFGEPQGGVQ